MILSRLRALAPPLALLALAALFLAQPARAAQSLAAALLVCRDSLLPALFPFFVLSRMVLDCPGAELLALGLRPLCRALGLRSPKAPLLLLLGWLGGYTALAAALAEAVRRGEVPQAEAERLLVPGILSSPGFAMAVGGGLLGRPLLGVCFCLAALGGNLAAALALAPFWRQPPALAVPPAPAAHGGPAQGAGLAAAIAGAVQSSLSVCGCVVLFRMLLDLARGLLGLGRGPAALLAALLEVSTGCTALVQLEGPAALYGPAAAMSLLSLSVWSQLSALLQGRVRLRWLLLSRPLQLAASLGLLRLLLGLLPGHAEALSTLAPRVIPLTRLPGDRAFLLFALLCAALEALRRALQSHKSPL